MAQLDEIAEIFSLYVVLPRHATALAAIMHNVMGFHTCVEQTRANSDQLIGVM
jgi:hypothetical protein